jgi:hypothetical protein
MHLDDLRDIGLFAGTDDGQLRARLEVGTEVPFAPPRRDQPGEPAG